MQNVLDSFVQSANAKYAYSILGGVDGNITPYESICEETINPDGKRPRA